VTPRDSVITRIKERLGGKTDKDIIAQEADSLFADIEACRPTLANGSLSEAFTLRATSEKVGSTVARIKSLSDVPAAVKTYLTDQGLDLQTALQPDPALLGLNWAPLSIAQGFSSDQRVVVQKALWAIAETGTLVFHSSPTSPTLLSYLPLHVIVVVEEKDILAYLEDYVDVAHLVPRNVNFITGPSGTTDIEGSLVRGAHGPGYVHIILVDSL